MEWLRLANIRIDDSFNTACWSHGVSNVVMILVS